MTSNAQLTGRGNEFVMRSDYYGVVLFAVVALVIWLMAGPQDNLAIWGIGALIVAAVTLGQVIRTSVLRQNLHKPLLVGLAIMVAVGIGSVFMLDSRIASGVVATELLIISLAGPVLIARALVARRTLDTQTVLGAITIYLLIGIAGAMVVSVIAAFESLPVLTYSGEATDGTVRDRVYYAFVTLTTTGYGDFTPRTGAARAAAISIAITGQLYLVIAMAGIVSLLTMRRATPDA